MQPYVVGDTNQHIKEMLKEEQVDMVLDGDDSDMGEADDWLLLTKWHIFYHIICIYRSFEGFSLENSIVLIPFVPLYFLAFFGFVHHYFNAGVIFFRWDLFEHIMSPQVLYMPLMELKHVSYAVQSSLRFQQICIFRQKSCVDNSSTIVLGLEMWIREADEDDIQTFLREVLPKMPHGISPDNSNMTIILRLSGPHSFDLISHIIDQFIPNLHANDKFIRKQRRKSKQKPTISTTNINNWHIFPLQSILPFLLIKTWMLNSIAIRFSVLNLITPKFKWIMRFPINKGMMRRMWKWCSIEWVDMCPHSIIFLLWHQPFLLD